jgi:alkanesulfonate monooxygenase SsuD/methylene tetrahydromethanopterin reductase-like flavin-dependent oxidoreductase (luciferase family)
MTVDPCARQEHLPIWVGGRTRRSLRRAATLADGWCPFAVPVATAAEWLRPVDLPDRFEVVMPADRLLDPSGAPDRTADTLGTMAEAGVTTLSARFVHHSLEHYLEQLEALAGIGSRTP